MAISLVSGGNIAGSAINGGNVTIALPTLLENDVVYIIGGYPSGSGAGNAAISTSGYTLIKDTFSDGGSLIVGVWRKRMGASPDTQVVGTGTGNVAYAAGYAVLCLRGVDTSTSEDATPTLSGPTFATNPQSPSITTITNGAWVLSMAASAVNDASVTEPSGYSNKISINGNDDNDITVGAASILKATAGVETPPSWTTWSSGGNQAFSVAVRPAILGNIINPGLRKFAMCRHHNMIIGMKGLGVC